MKKIELRSASGSTGRNATLTFEDAGNGDYRITADNWNNHVVLTISKDEILWIATEAFKDPICSMANCDNAMADLTGDHRIYSTRLSREIPCCADCYEAYEDLMAYGRPDYGIAWLKNTEDLLTD